MGMRELLDVVLEDTGEGEASEASAESSKLLNFHAENSSVQESSLQEALKALEVAQARANHAEEEMSRCREAADRLKGNLRRIAIVRPFCEPEKENSNWMQVRGPRELQVQVQSAVQDGEKARGRRRMSTGCIPDSIQRCNKRNFSAPRIMDFENIVGHEDSRIFQVLKPNIEACVAGEATEVLCVFVCGAASYDDKASFADRLAAKVVAQLETAAAAAPMAKVQMQMFEVHADGELHRDFLEANFLPPKGRSISGTPTPAATSQLHPNLEEPMTNSFRKLIRESRSLQSQRFFPVSHFAMSFRISRPSKPVGQIVIVDVDSSDRSWTCCSSQTNLWHLLGGFQDFCPAMLLMLDPAPSAQTDTLKTLQFGQRFQSSLLRFGPRHGTESADWHQSALKEATDPLREELTRLQKETSEVLEEVHKMKLQIEKKNQEITELRKKSARQKPIRQLQKPRLQIREAALKLPKASARPCKPGNVSPGPLLPSRPSALRPAAHRPLSSSADRNSKDSSSLRLRLTCTVQVRPGRPRQLPERPILSRLRSPMQAEHQVRGSPKSPKEPPVRLEKCLPFTRLDRPVSRQRGLCAVSFGSVQKRVRLPLLPIGGRGLTTAGSSGSQCMKDIPSTKAATGQTSEARVFRDGSLSSSSSGSSCGNWNTGIRFPEPKAHNARIQDLLPLRLDLTRVFQDAPGFHEACEGTPKTPRGRPPMAWWNSEVVAPASARGRAPSNGEETERPARSLYVADLMTPRTALMLMPPGEGKDPVSPLTLLRPLCQESLAWYQDEGRRWQSVDEISVSSDEDDIRARLSQELHQREKLKQNDQENKQVLNNAEEKIEKDPKGDETLEGSCLLTSENSAH